MDKVQALAKRVSKAIGSAVTGGLIALAGVRPDGITAQDWGLVVAAVVGAFAFTYFAPANTVPE